MKVEPAAAVIKLRGAYLEEKDPGSGTHTLQILFMCRRQSANNQWHRSHFSEF